MWLLHTTQVHVLQSYTYFKLMKPMRYRWISLYALNPLPDELQVDRYIYFPACAEKFRRLSGSLLEQGADENPAAGLHVSTRVRCKVWNSAHHRLLGAIKEGVIFITN